MNTKNLKNLQAVVESYAGAAAVLDLSISDVEKAIVSAAQRYGGCMSCLYSRAPRDASEYAYQRGALPVMRRRCVLGLSQSTCGSFEPIAS